jgi:GT2 family glycosyltransferase
MTRSTIVIPVYNQARLTERCLQALGQGDFEVIIVDDASSDETPELLARLGKRVRTVQHSVNQGFATSCNHGAAVASGEFLVFLNNDTVPRPGWLDALVNYADRHPEASVIGSKLVYPDNTIQHAGVVICQDGYPRHIYTGFPAEHPAVNKSRPFQIVTGASMLVRRSAFGQVGGFDSSYRNGFEDVDFCLRLREAGHDIHYCAESTVEHLESVSPGRFKSAGANVARYRERWFGRVRPDDVNYYLQDGLLQFSYEGSFPFSIDISPRLAVVEESLRASDLERLLSESARQLANLRRENIRLSSQLSAEFPESDEARYDRLRWQIQQFVELETTPGTTVLVVSKGDRALLELKGRRGWHFPQNENGVYAGYHPANSAEAIKHLEDLRARGAAYLLIPATSLWWLDYYEDFRHHLESRYIRLPTPGELCVLYRLIQLEEEPGTLGPWQQQERVFRTDFLEAVTANLERSGP